MSEGQGGESISIARVFDGVDPASGEPFFAADHPKISDTAERERLAAYLDAGTPILATVALDPDRVDPSRGDVVPLSFRTDGTWVWTDTVAYYLRTHGLGPDPDLYRHIVAAGYTCPEIDNETAQRILEEFYRESANAAGAQDPGGQGQGGQGQGGQGEGQGTDSAGAGGTAPFTVTSTPGEVPPPLRLGTPEGTLTVASNLTDEEFQILERLRREAAEQDRGARG